MILSELIALAQLKLAQHGDLEVLSDNYYPINSIDHSVSGGDFNEDWGMPKGFEFIRIRESK